MAEGSMDLPRECQDEIYFQLGKIRAVAEMIMADDPQSTAPIVLMDAVQSIRSILDE